MNTHRQNAKKSGITEVKQKAFLTARLLDWFDCNRRILPWRENRTSYGTWISEIMLQQTRASTVIPYYRRFLSLFPDISTLAGASQQEIYKAWEGLGYYSRAANLQRGARYCIEHFGGSLPSDIRKLQSIPGIGPYTAGALASLAFGLPEPAVDGNAIRVFARLYALPICPQDSGAASEIAARVRCLLPRDRAGDFNEAVMDLGAVICTPGKPSCGICPLSTDCSANLLGVQADLPLRKQKKPLPVLSYTIAVFRKHGQIFIRQRPDTGLLANLYEFPAYPGLLTEDELRQKILRENKMTGLNIRSIVSLGEASHTFSHVKWKMDGYLIEVTEEEAENVSEAVSPIQPAEMPNDEKIPRMLLFSEKNITGDYYSISKAAELAFPSALKAYTTAVLREESSAGNADNS